MRLGRMFEIGSTKQLSGLEHMVLAMTSPTCSKIDESGLCKPL